MKTAKYVIVAMGSLLLLSSCFMSSPWLAGGEGDSVYLPPDIIKDTTRSGSEPFQFETLLPVDLNIEIDFYELSTAGLDKAAIDEIDAIAGKAVVVITNSKGDVVYEGAVQDDGSLDDQVVLPADPEDMTLSVKAYGFQDRSVKINDFVKYSKIDRKMGLMSEGLSAKELGEPEDWDRDGDLVPNIYDAFPDDADYAFTLRYPPNEDECLTVAYEDLYLEKDAGDADYNDFLVKYVIYENIGCQVTKKNMLMNATIEATAEVKIAGYDHLFGIAFGYYLDKDETMDGEFNLTYFDSDGNERTIDQNTFDLSKLLVPVPESPESPFNYKAVIPLFGSTEAATNEPTKKKAVVTVTFEGGIERNKVQLAPYDPFLYVWNTSFDIHLVGKQPLPSIPELPWINSIKGPDSGDAMGTYTFMDGVGYPWALLVPVDWEHPPETVHIEEVYPFFENWRMSDGVTDTNWYLRKKDPDNKPPSAPILSADALTFDSADSALQEEKIDITLGTDPDWDDPVTLHWTDLPTYVKFVENTEGSESHKVTVDLSKVINVPEELNIYFWCEDAEGARSGFTPLNLTFEESAVEFDLSPGVISFTGDSVADGNNLSITLPISNLQSGIVSTDFSIHFYLSEDISFSEGAPDTDLGSKVVSTDIAGNSTFNYNTALSIPELTGLPAVVYIYAVVDSLAEVAEADEGNNTSTPGQAGYVLVYDEENGSRSYDLRVDTFPPTGSESTATEVSLYDSGGTQIFPDTSSYIGNYAYLVENGLSDGIYYVKVEGATSVQSGPYGISVCLVGMSYSAFATALNDNTEDRFENDDSTTGGIPDNPAPILITTPLNRYLGQFEADWFILNLP